MVSFFPSYADGVKESMDVLSSFCGKVQFVSIPCESLYKGKHLLALKSLFASDPYSINWLKAEEFQKRLMSFMASDQYDLVHFDTISLCPYKKAVLNIPTVLDHHNIESHMMMRRADKETNLLLKAYFSQEGIRLRQYEEKYCGTFELNITCSELDSQRLLEVDPGVNVKEIPNGVDIEYFKPQDAALEPNSLIFVGSMNWYPNVEAMYYFIENVWPLIIRKVPDCVLHIIGANPPDSLKKITGKNIAIQLHGFVDDIRPYMDRAMVYICPIRDGGGTKLKLLDAFSMKKAVVAHPVACEGINVQPGHNVFFAETPEDFVEQITLLFADPELRQSTGENARNLVKSAYSYDKIGLKLVEMYEQLCVCSK